MELEEETRNAPPPTAESDQAGTEGSSKGEKRKRPTTNQLQRTALDLEQEIQRKRLEVVNQELENTKQVARINMKKEQLIDMQITKLQRELELITGQF